MNHFLPSEADAPYRTLASYVITKRNLYHEGFRDFSLKLSQLQRELGELAAENDWKWVLSKFKRYRFELTGAPVPFNHLTIVPAPLEQLRSKLNWCIELYPHYSGTSTALLNLYETLGRSEDNPMRDWLSRELQDGPEGDIGVVLREPRLIEPTEEALNAISSNKRIHVLTPPQLRDTQCYSRLIVFGPARWYFDDKEYVFRSPRAPRIDLAYYQWIRDPWLLKPALEGSIFTGPNLVETAHMPSAATTPAIDLISAEESVPSIDWGQYSTAADKTDGDDPTQDITTARLFLLEDDHAVYLEESEGARSLIINLEATGKDVVRKLPATGIVDGMFILIRSAGGGDLIVPIADKVLGLQSTEFRFMQAQWKNHLIKLVRAKSHLAASIDLLNLGAILANEMNLRNWMSARNIKTQEKGDFMAIMKYIEFPPNKATKYWNAMCAIDGAHRRAGTIIRKKLIHEIRESDLTDLIRKGQKTFELKGEGGGSITAYRIKGKAPETTIVPTSRILRLIKAEED